VLFLKKDTMETVEKTIKEMCERAVQAANDEATNDANVYASVAAQLISAYSRVTQTSC
jgi:hypothetical protein